MASRRALAVAALAAALAVVPSTASARAHRAHLAYFPNCSTFVHYARHHALGELRTMAQPVYSSPFPGGHVVMPQRGAPNAETAPSAPSGGQQGQDFSGTNVQEAGVDEPDLVKTDGKTIFAVENGSLFAIDATSSPPRLVGSLPLDGYGQQLLLAGDKLLVLGGAGIAYPIGVPIEPPTPGPPVRAAIAYPIVPRNTSTLSEVDVSDPAHMKFMKTISVNGGYLDARMTGHTARVIFTAMPTAIPLLAGARPGAVRAKIGRSTTPLWRPSYTLRRGRRGHATRHALVRCTAIQRPVDFSGLDSLTVLTIDLDKGLDPVDSDAIMTDGQTVYASTKSLYVATQQALVERPDTAQPPPDQFTEIHKFDISDPDQTTYQGSGVVSGTLLNQYSMSEQDGFLRVASTEAPLWWSPDTNTPSQSYVTVLQQQGGALTQLGRVGGLGQGQRIYAVRFIGDIGYVVTFRQIDPLYTIGLSDPANPRVLGSVELQGYSAYLHPVGDGLLLGVGVFVDQSGNEPGGTQLSLFDVSDPANPKRIASRELASGSSTTVGFDPHAFLWWDPAKLAVLPVQIYNYDPNSGSSSQFSGAIGFHVTKADGINEAGRVTHQNSDGYQPPIDRSLVIGDQLFTVSSLGLRASDLGTFADHGFVAFPQPQPPVVTAPPPSGP